MQAFLSGKDCLGQIWRKASQKKKRAKLGSPNFYFFRNTRCAKMFILCARQIQKVIPKRLGVRSHKCQQEAFWRCVHHYGRAPVAGLLRWGWRSEAASRLPALAPRVHMWLSIAGGTEEHRRWLSRKQIQAEGNDESTGITDTIQNWGWLWKFSCVSSSSLHSWKWKVSSRSSCSSGLKSEV